MNVLDNGLIPRVMSLKDALTAFVNHRRTVLERRSTHRLEKIAARLDILEGYLVVYLDLDKVIRIIRTEDEPKPKLIKAFKLTDTQADAILNMRLRSLRKLEEMEIRREHSDLTKEQKDAEEAARLGEDEVGQADRGGARDRRQVRAEDGTGQAPHRIRQGCRDRQVSRPSPKRSWRWKRQSSASRSPWSVRRRAGYVPSRAIRKTVRRRQISRGRPAPLLDPCRDHRQAAAVRDRRALLHARLRQAAGRARQWRGHPQLHRSAAGGRHRVDVRAQAGPEAAAGGRHPAMASLPPKTMRWR